MDLIFFGLFLIIACFFYVAGGYLRNLLWVFVGGAGFFLIGLNCFATGVSYNDFNATVTNFSFSPDYFEYANDTVSCANCSDVNYTASSNTTPPTCCAHDVNTTINGRVSELVERQTYPVFLSDNERLTIAFFLTCAGLLTILELAIAWNQGGKMK
jgi:hypothetical protein